MSFQALSRFWLFLKTTKLEPPTNEDDVLFAGICMTPYLFLKSAPPTFSTRTSPTDRR